MTAYFIPEKCYNIPIPNIESLETLPVDHDAKVTISCETNYTLVTSSTQTVTSSMELTCQHADKWTPGPYPTCVRGDYSTG